MPQAYDPAFSDLLDLLAKKIETVRKQPIPADEAWKNDAQVLALKLFRHACSAKQLADGGTIDWGNGLETSFIDHASLKAIARAQLETLLVFFYVFGSRDADLTIYRHTIWKLGGVMDRLKFTATTPESKAKQQVDRQQADALIAQLPRIPAFNAENSKRRKRIMLGEWRYELSWQHLGEAAGFHPSYFRDIYGFLCGYSHSSWASILQISQAKAIKDQAAMAGAIMGVVTSVMARFIRLYSAYFPAANSVPISREATNALDHWSFGKAEMTAHYDKAVGRPK